MERPEQIRIVEALILASPEPISAARLGRITPDCNAALVRDLIGELGEMYEKQDRSFEIWEVAGGYQVRTRAEFSGYLQQLHKQRPLRLSRASLETLSIVAYKQPATRGEIEQVRGVDAGAVLKSLMERQLVRMVGHREVPGRPMLYGTTRRFLEIFGLDSLKELPVLRELDELAREKGIVLPGAGLRAEGGAADAASAEAADSVSSDAEERTGESEGESEGQSEDESDGVHDVEHISDEELAATAEDVATHEDAPPEAASEQRPEATEGEPEAAAPDDESGEPQP